MRRVMMWSIRRELWENRSIYIAPMITAAVMLVGFALGSLGLARHKVVTGQPYSLSAMLIIVTAFLVAFFYCLDALHGERRDRSILFWKSLPVSDTASVLAKLAVPMAALPAIVFVVVIAMHLLMLIVGVAATSIAGASVAELWQHLPLFRMELVLLYGLAVSALWHAPLFAWLLFVSSWAKRATFLCAVLPPIGLCVLEKVAFGSSSIFDVVKHRFTGSLEEAFSAGVSEEGLVEHVPHLDPLRFLSSPGLWLGLLVAAALVVATIRLRRSGGAA